MHLSDTTRLTRVVFGACLIVAPVLMFASDVLGANDSSNDNTYLSRVAAHPARDYLGGVAMMLGTIALVGAVLGIAHLVRTRRPALANVAGTAGVVGAFAMYGWASLTMFVEVPLAQNDNRAAMVSLYHEVGNAGWVAPNMVLMIVFFLALIALSVGLWMTRTVPRWAPALMIVAFLALFFSGGNDSVSSLIPDIVLAAAMGTIGLSVLRRSDQEWSSGSRAADAVGEAPAASPGLA